MLERKYCEDRLSEWTGEKVDLSKTKDINITELHGHLRAIEQFNLPEKRNPFVSQIENDLKELVIHKRKLETTIQCNEQIEGVKAAFQFCGMLGIQLKNPHLQRGAELGLTATQVVVGGIQLIGAQSALAALGPAYAVAAGVLTLVDLCQKKRSKPDPFTMTMLQNMQIISEQIIEGFNHLSGQINDMHGDMRSSFKHISTQINDMHIEMRESVNVLLQAACALLKNINQLDWSRHDNHMSVMHALDDIKKSQKVLDEKMDVSLLENFAELLSKSQDLCGGKIQYENKSSIQDIVRQVRNWIKWKGRASVPAYTGACWVSISHSLQNELIRDTSRYSTLKNFGFLVHYATYHLGIDLLQKQESKLLSIETRERIDAVFNPLLFMPAVENYINLKQNFPQLIIDPEEKDFQEVVDAAANQKRIIQSFRNPIIFQKIFDDYQKAITDFTLLTHEAFTRQNQLIRDNYTLNFDIRKNLTEIAARDFKETLPVNKKTCEGFTVDDHQVAAHFVLAERLGLISFFRNFPLITFDPPATRQNSKFTLRVSGKADITINSN